jgi:hypothetical protein
VGQLYTLVTQLSDHRRTKFWDAAEWENGCLVWKGAQQPSGYGRIIIGGKQLRAHRVAYALSYGDFDDELLVLHRCDTPLCIRPEHLFLGTTDDNMADMTQKGRSAKGLRNGSAVLSDDQIREIRRRYERYSQGPNSQVAMANEFGVSQASIWRAVHRFTYSEVE